MKNGPPSENDWWQTEPIDEFSSSSSDTSSNKQEIVCEFHNCGLSTWEEARKKWRAPTEIKRPPVPPPPPYDEVVQGLTQVTRTYELPHKSALPDIIKIFVDIWDCEKE